MSQIYLPVDLLYELDPDPVFLLRDQRIVYRNQAGKDLFPDAVPELLLDPPQEGAGVFCWQEGSYQARIQQWEGLTLIRIKREERVTILPDRRLPLLVQKLRIPLAALMSAGERLERVLTPEQQAEAAGAVGQGIKAQLRLLRLANSLELAALAPLETPYDFRPEPLDLQGLCHEAWRMLSGLAGEVGCTVAYTAQPGNYLVLCDEKLLLTQLYHLASNAFRASQPGGAVEFRLEKKGKWAYIIFEDNGPGLSREAMAALFAPDMGGEQLKEQAKGSGLGLGIFICRKIASLHDGAILFSNRSQGGLRAVISIPLRREEEFERLKSPGAVDSSHGVPLVLRELSDVLPARCFRTEDL